MRTTAGVLQRPTSRLVILHQDGVVASINKNTALVAEGETVDDRRVTQHNAIPSSVRKPAALMIVLQLQANPARRPSVDNLLQNEFFTSGIMPAALPLSCLTTAPRPGQLEGVVSLHPDPLNENLLALRDQLASLLSHKLKCRPECLTDELSDPAAQPLVWVDYSHKYGFGYQLCDESVGVMFNDDTKIIVFANGVNVHYINQANQERYITTNEYPAELEKKMKLLSFFRNYMTELVKAGASVQLRESDGLSRLPHLHQWFKTIWAVFMHLSNGTLQINFEDHTKIILCPLMQAVTYIDVEQNFRTFRFSTIKEHGCDKKLFDNLQYALKKINRILANKQ